RPAFVQRPAQRFAGPRDALPVLCHCCRPLLNLLGLLADRFFALLVRRDGRQQARPLTVDVGRRRPPLRQRRLLLRELFEHAGPLGRRGLQLPLRVGEPLGGRRDQRLLLLGPLGEFRDLGLQVRHPRLVRLRLFLRVLQRPLGHRLPLRGLLLRV